MTETIGIWSKGYKIKMIESNVEVSVAFDEDVLLVDFSYFVIYRYFALQRYIKLSEQEYDEETFLKKFGELIRANLRKIAKTFKVNRNVILLGDCSRECIWRTDSYPEYKETRDKQWEKNPISPNVFVEVHERVIPALSTEDGYQFVCRPSMEADDLAYCIKTKLSLADYARRIVMVTNDSDYLQMHDERTHIVNLPNLKSIFTSKRSVDNSAGKTLWMKILVGDLSDNIRGVISKSKATKILAQLTLDDLRTDADSKLIECVLEAGGSLSQLELNCRLIDFRNIPSELMNTVIIKKCNDS